METTRPGAWWTVAMLAATIAACGGAVSPLDPEPSPTPPIVRPSPPSPPPVVPPSPPTVPTEPPPTPTEPPSPPPVDPPPPCAASTFYADADGDGWGDDASAVVACDPPVGFVAQSGDCMDANADVHPGQTAFFTAHRGDGSFDYDCDAAESLERAVKDPDFCACGIVPATGCSRTEGWATAIPTCGEAADFNRAKPGPNVQTCEPDVVTIVQGCR